MVKNTPSDVTLVNQYISGNEAALEVLINRHRNEVFRYIHRIVRDRETSQDIFQETFIKVIHLLKSGSYYEDGRFLAWLIKIAHNMTMDQIRKSKRRNSYEQCQEDMEVFDVVCDDNSTAEEYMMKHQTAKHLKELLQYLPEDQHQMIKMRHYDGLSFREISEETNTNINTSIGRMRYALINLRKLIEEHKIDIR